MLTMCPLSRYRLNRGLAEFDALFIVPVMQVQWTMLSVVEGMIYFQEYKEWDAVWEPVVFFSSLLITLPHLVHFPPSCRRHEWQGRPSAGDATRRDAPRRGA